MNTVHLVSNAHLDPVWAWTLEEGVVEAISTFRTAVDLLHLFPEYAFVKNESQMYEWIEKLDPKLFEDIKRLVADGRWVVAGGWYNQPDCNMAAGETLVRQILYGKSYFKEKFGVDTKVAYNLDPFGHNGGLPQILVKSGYKYYVHFRPMPDQMKYPGDLYVWRGVDGSEVIACRPPSDAYCTEADAVLDRLKHAIQFTENHDRDVMAFWGVGDHGGGATVNDLLEIRDFVGGWAENGVKHSHPEAFFESVSHLKEALPVVDGDLQRCFTGCYTSSAYTKRAYYKAEGMLVQAERLATLASLRAGIEYPYDSLASAWKDILFNSFHDILAGTCSVAGTQEAHDVLGRCSMTAKEIRLRSMLSLAALDPPAMEGIPVYLFNPHSFTYKGPIEIDFMPDYRPSWTEKVHVRLKDCDGKTISSQEETPTCNASWEWRKKLVLWAELPPLSNSRYMISKTDVPEDASQTVSVSDDSDCMTVNTGVIRAEFDKATGLLRSLIDSSDAKELLKAPGFVPIVIDDLGDSWGDSIESYKDVVGSFSAADEPAIARMIGKYDTDSPVTTVRLVENGPVRVVVETLLSWGFSTMVQKFYFYAGIRYFEIKLKVNWNEPRRMLKLSLPTSLLDSRIKCEIPYGAIEREADGTEHVGQRWVMLESGGYGIGIINTGQYGFDAKDGEIRLSLLRSPIYCHERGMALDPGKTYDFVDMGVHEIKLGCVFGPFDIALQDTIKHANQMNVPVAVMPYFPKSPRSLPQSAEEIKPRSFLSVYPENVILGALKRSEDGRGFIARVHESSGKQTRAELRLGDYGCGYSYDMSPYELKTFRIYDDKRVVFEETDLLEQHVGDDRQID